MSKRVDSALVTNGDKSITASCLFEAAISRQWDELSALCDQYDHPCESSPNPNPLFAAVLHTAIVMAAKHKALSLFADVAPEEKLPMFGLSLVDDFCPFRSFDEGKDEARSRRKAIAKLCRIHPGWISAPLVGTCEKTASITPNHGTTALHLAVRMRCPALVRLLLKYCPNAARVPDEYGYLPLHYAVRPVDEIQVYKKAITMHNARSSSQNGLAGPTEVQNPNDLNDAGGGTGGGVSFGMRMVHRGTFVLNGISEMVFLARCRVKAHNASSKNRLKCVSAKTKRLPSMTAEPNATDASSMSFSATDVRNSNRKSPTRRSSRIKKNDEIQQAKAQQYHLFSNLYSSPSSLVRAMMFLGCVEEDSAKFIKAESQASSSDSQGTFAASWVSLRASRPWQTEQYRVRTVRMLTDVYPEGMAVASNHDKTEEEQEQKDDSDEEREAGGGGGGDTPFIIACRTLKGGMLGEDDDDEEFNMNMVNMEGHELPGDAMNDDVAAAARNQNDIDVVEAGEEEADYEADLKDQEIANKDVDLDKKRSSVESLSNLDNPLDDNGRDEVENYNEQALAAVDNNEEEDELNRDDPLGAIRTMIATSRRSNDLTALLTTNDDGDTPLHTASRIGCHRRLIHLLLNAEPRPASMTAKDHATPLHLMVRRCSHLAPDGVGGLSTYDAETVQLMVNAAGRDAMARCNSDFRTPLHEACYYGASPEVLEVLAEAEGGREALLLRDREGYSPLGTYCRHASDFYAMRVLCDHCPEAAACMAHGRRLPLHRVVASFNLAVNVDVLNLLGTAYPRGIDTKDAHGMTPLALLCHSYKGPMNVDLPKLQSNQTTLGRW
ncbi:hypothetical protein HJC23_010313 [Cyclotella cryptica]|uniref:Ankyrin repeat protein n=1 Tax=Cyclotella cryptica TaxID=29204 RepID=A0ABD3QNE6_9STRA